MNKIYNVEIETTTVTKHTYTVVTTSQEQANEHALNNHKNSQYHPNDFRIRTRTFEIIPSTSTAETTHYADSRPEAFAFSRGVLYTNPNLYPRITEKNGRWEIRFVENEEED